MNLQDLFYLVAIITMGIHILFLMMLAIILLAIKKKIDETKEEVTKRAEMIKNFITHPTIIMTTLGKMILTQTLTQIGKLLRR